MPFPLPGRLTSRAEVLEMNGANASKNDRGRNRRSVIFLGPSSPANLHDKVATYPPQVNRIGAAAKRSPFAERNKSDTIGPASESESVLVLAGIWESRCNKPKKALNCRVVPRLAGSGSISLEGTTA